MTSITAKDNQGSSSNSHRIVNDAKKRKLETVEDFVMVPVAKKDFEKVNEIAENYMIVRHTDKVDKRVSLLTDKCEK